ncbi:MAG: hypothetical protein GDA46_01665 [Bdellovibrionales bacterium]|nr:hypothetical protein [Bdellovibrionales bacterium]
MFIIHYTIKKSFSFIFLVLFIIPAYGSSCLDVFSLEKMHPSAALIYEFEKGSLKNVEHLLETYPRLKNIRFDRKPLLKFLIDQGYWKIAKRLNEIYPGLFRQMEVADQKRFLENMDRIRKKDEKELVTIKLILNLLVGAAL